MQDSNASGPVTAAERVISLDVLRGFALFGILLVNIVFFANPLSEPFNFSEVESGIDEAIGWFIGFFAQGKFYPLFSLLFGLGFAVQLQRASARQRSFVPVYLRRLLVLLAIGIAHATLVWAGDILVVYAILGFLLLLVGRGSARWLLILAAIAYALQVLVVVGMQWSMQVAADCEAVLQDDVAQDIVEDAGFCRSAEMQDMLAGFEEARQEGEQMRDVAWQAYTQGSFADITAVRVDEFGMMLSHMGFFGAQVLAMFLLGAWLGRRGVFAAPAEHRVLLRNMLLLGVLVGLPLSAWFASVNLEVDYTEMPNPGMAQAFMINLFAGPLLALAYAAAIVLAMQTHAAKLLRVLAPVGRMALTNYLMQSIICTLIFYSYGLALMRDKPGMLLQLGIVVVVFLLQIVWSNWWLKRQAYGPAEWLWRAATYMRKP